MRGYILARAARSDLSEIWEYIAQDNITAATRVILDLEAAMDRLAEMPNLGHRHGSLSDRYRCWSVYSYLIVYLPDTSPLEIARVVHGQRDLPDLLKE